MQNAKLRGRQPRNFSFLILHLSLAVALVGCALLRPAEAPLQVATAEELVGLLQEREAAIETMKGLFRAQIKGPGIPFTQRVEGAMFFRHPSSLRVRGFNHVGGELFEFVLGDDLYRLRLPQMGRVITGRLAELDRLGQFERLFRLTMLAMSGAVGIAPVSKDERLRLSAEGDRYRLDVFLPDSVGATGPVRRLWFDRRSLQVVREERLTATGAVDATMQFEDFRPVSLVAGGAPLPAGTTTLAAPLMKPFKIMITDGEGQGSLTLTFHELQPNAPLRPDELGVAATGLGAGGDGLAATR